MEAKLVYMGGCPHWKMPEGSFVRAENDDFPWDIIVKTPEGDRSLKSI